MTTVTSAASSSAPASVLVSMPAPCNGAGVSYTCTSIARNLDQSALRLAVVTPRSHLSVKENMPVVETLPAPLRWLPYRYVRRVAGRWQESSYFEAVKRAAAGGSVIAYVWPEPSLSLAQGLQETGALIVRESVNCHLATCKRILDAEYRRLGLAPQLPFADSDIDTELRLFKIYDYIFCSNPYSEQSMLENGVPAEKIKEASFGWDPDRFRGDSKALPQFDGTTFIFVGYICVRKGAHLLLQYWARSGIRGRLVLVGRLEPAIEALCAEHLARDDVQVIPYTRNLGPYYRSADAFVFPSLEEGGPQVTYEAAGCRLPVITSPMGGARAAVNNTTGYIADPHNEEAWIEAMRKIAKDQDLRRRMGQAAYERALQFTWQKVGAARGKVFREILSAPGGERTEPPAPLYASRAS